MFLSTFTTVPNLFLLKQQSFPPSVSNTQRSTTPSFDQNANPESRSVFFFLLFYIPCTWKFPHILFICVCVVTEWTTLCSRKHENWPQSAQPCHSQPPLLAKAHTHTKSTFRSILMFFEVYCCNIVKNRRRYPFSSRQFTGWYLQKTNTQQAPVMYIEAFKSCSPWS